MTENNPLGRGGFRPGAGRPIGAKRKSSPALHRKEALVEGALSTLSEISNDSAAQPMARVLAAGILLVTTIEG